MHGRVCVITGASAGIGRATAIALARQGATLALVCRDRGRGEDTIRAIHAEAPSAPVELFLADLAVQAQIRDVAAALLARYPAIHVLLNNAGVVNLERKLTADGIEEVFAVNHLGYFLLTNLLRDRLVASAPARIVNVASDAHKFGGPLDFDDLGCERHPYRSMAVYGRSKLANILFTYELARRLAGTGVTVNCLHPGAVATSLGHNNGRIATLLTRLVAPFFRTPEQGAATSIYLASSPEVDGMTGRYFANRKARRSNAASNDEAAQHRLWDVSTRLTGLTA